jgi:hypothetical protein
MAQAQQSPTLLYSIMRRSVQLGTGSLRKEVTDLVHMRNILSRLLSPIVVIVARTQASAGTSKWLVTTEFECD